MQNSAARLICRLRRFDHVTDERSGARRLQDRCANVQGMHGIAPEYLRPVVCVTDLPDRQSLRSTGTNRQVVPLFKLLSTIDTRAFPVASPHVW